MAIGFVLVAGLQGEFQHLVPLVPLGIGIRLAGEPGFGAGPPLEKPLLTSRASRRVSTWLSCDASEDFSLAISARRSASAPVRTLRSSASKAQNRLRSASSLISSSDKDSTAMKAPADNQDALDTVMSPRHSLGEHFPDAAYQTVRDSFRVDLKPPFADRLPDLGDLLRVESRFRAGDGIQGG
jgi:hypothetical protein